MPAASPRINATSGTDPGSTEQILAGTPYVTSAVWPAASRAKQYAGNRVVKVGGISLDIDVDLVASAVARG